MTEAERITVDARGVQQRLDRFLAATAKWGSRSHVQRLIAAGLVRVDGRQAKPGTMVRAGQLITVQPGAPAGASAVEAEAIPLDVLYEDEWLLVINKPAGMVVHPAPGHRQGTLVSALLYHWHGPRGGLDPLRPGLVHRLDKDTSGVLVVAKDADTLADLGAQFRKREVDKQYLAFVWGRLRRQRGTIAQPIGRHRVHRKRMAVRAGARDALTSFEVLECFDDITLLRLFPRTGRTHQIRVHLAAIGHAIAGDPVYGRGRARGRQVRVARQALHAERLTFRHPHTGERVSFTAPLPDDLLALWRRCGLTMNSRLSSVFGSNAPDPRSKTTGGPTRSPRSATILDNNTAERED